VSDARSLDLRLPPRERSLLMGLLGPWSDLRYVPGPGFTSPLDPGVYRSSFFAVPAVGPAVRISSLVAPAFGGDLCRIRIEPVAAYRADRLGSLFEPKHRGQVYAMPPDRSDARPTSPIRAEWRYGGPSLAQRFGAVTGLRLLRERGRGGRGQHAFGWHADRGLVVSGPDGQPGLFLAEPHAEEQVALAPSLGLYGALVDRPPTVPGASPRELLGYGDWTEPPELEVSLVDVGGEAPHAGPR